MFYGFIITDNGKDVLANMMSGEILTITKIILDKGTAESEETARNLEEPIDPGPEATSTVPIAEGNAVKMTIE